MPELSVLLGPLQGLLTWFQKNRHVQDEQKTAALHSLNRALIATRRYIEESETGSIDRAREFELAELWSTAATQARFASRDLSRRLDDKSQYWTKSLKWSREEVLRKRIDLESVQEEVRKLLDGA